MKKVLLIAGLIVLVLLIVSLRSGSKDDLGASILSEGGIALADLVIKSANFKAAEFNDSIILDLVVENQGASTVKDFVITGSWLENPSLSTVVQLSVSGGLESGESKNFSQLFDLPGVRERSGRYTFSVDRCAQSSCNDQVPESNENNNDFIAPFNL